MAERAAAPAPRAGQETGCATTGDHRDFAGAASAEGASQASRRAEMDIRLRMAVYGLALSPLAVDYDSSELGRIAFARAFASPAAAAEPADAAAACREPGAPPRELQGSERAPSGHKLGGAGSGGSRRELGDTDCVVSCDGGRARPAHGRASETRMAQAGLGAKQESLPHTDLLANMTRLQQDMIERQRKLEARKAERRRLEREEESKMRDTICTLQTAIQKVMLGFDSLDDDFERRASSRASSQASIWLGAHEGHTQHEDVHDEWRKDDDDKESQRKRQDESGPGAAPAGNGDTSITWTALHQSASSCRAPDTHVSSHGKNDWPSGRTVSPVAQRQNGASLHPSPEELRITQKIAMQKLSDDLKVWPQTPREEQELERSARQANLEDEQAKRKEARRALDRQLGGWKETSALDARYSARTTDRARQHSGGGGPHDCQDACALLGSDLGIGDPTCSPENRQYWKRERRKEEEREWEQTRQSSEFARSHAAPADEVNTVYITYDSQDPQGRKAYVGQTAGSQRSGKGVLTWQDGSKYSGEWSHDCPHGFGLEKYQNGSFYVGGFKDDARHGFGEFAVSPEMSYSGQWEEGQMHGIVYITEVHSDGQAKLIPARAERGEVHRRPNEPLSSIISVKQKVEVAVKYGKEASTEARDLAWGMSKNATQLARHVIASRSPSPYIGLDSTGKSPIPPLASTGGFWPGGSEEEKVEKGASYDSEAGASGARRTRPVSAGGARILAGGGLPPLPNSLKPSQTSGSRKRPVTANPSSYSQHPPKCSSPQSSGGQPQEPAVEVNIPRIKLAEDGLASVSASPAPMRPVSGEFVKFAPNQDALEVSLSEDNDASGFSDDDMQAAISLLLADDQKSDSPSCATPDELVALLLGESYTEEKGIDGDLVSPEGLQSLICSAAEIGLKMKHDLPLASSGYMRLSSPVQPDADQNPPFDESQLHSNYELVRSSRPHVTGYMSPTDMSTSVPRYRGSMPEVTTPRHSKLQHLGRHVSTPPPRSMFPLGAMDERALSPFLKPSPPTAAFGISPRSLRLRPLPRSVGSHGAITANLAAPSHLHRILPASYLVQGVHFGDDAAGENAPATHSTQSGPITTTTSTTTITTTTTVTSTGDSSTVRSVQMAQEAPHPANEDRMLVAVVTVAAAEVVASICDTVTKNIEALNRAQSFVKASAGTVDNNTSGPKPAQLSSTAAKLQESIGPPVSNLRDSEVEPESSPAAETTSQPSEAAPSTGAGKELEIDGNQETPTRNTARVEPAAKLREDLQPTGGVDTEPAGGETPVKSESTGSAGEIRGTYSEEELRSRGSSPVRFQDFDEMDREVGVIHDDSDDDRDDGLGEFLEPKWTANEVATKLGRSRNVQAARSPPIDDFLKSTGQGDDLLAPPAELAWRLISKFSTGFGLSSHELTAYSRTFVEKSRLKCFVSFINVMSDDQWLEVQNRFLEDAAKSHGVDSGAKVFVREEAFSWVLERHSRKPVNAECMELCGFRKPLQAIVSAAYEVTSGFDRGGRSSESHGPRNYDIVALRLLILHSFVETCWRVWQEMIIKTAIQAGGDTMKDQYDDSWKRHTTWGYGSIRTSPPAQSVMPWSQTEHPREPARPPGSQYISPLAQRVRPSSSKADFFRTKSATGSRPQSGSEGCQRPMSGQPVSARVSGPSPDYARLFPPNQRQRMETQAKARASPDVAPVATGFQALEFVRDELSRSAFANVAEAFAWFDLDRRQYVSVSEVDVGLKNLHIFGVDVASLFALCSNVQLRRGTREPEIGEAEFVRLFQWNDQLTSSGKGLFLFGERYVEVSDAAKQHQKRIIDKVKAHMRLRHGDDEQRDNLQGKSTSPQSHVQQRTVPRMPSAKRVRVCSPKDASPSSASNICPFCARAHEDDFIPTSPSPLKEPLLQRRQEEKTPEGRPKTHSPIPIHQHNYSIRHAHLPTGRFGSPLSSRLSQPRSTQAEGRRNRDQNMQSTARLEQLAAGWNYDALAQHLEAGYQQFSPHSILGVMVNAVLEHDLCRRIVWSQGKEGSFHAPAEGRPVERERFSQVAEARAGRPPRSTRRSMLRR